MKDGLGRAISYLRVSITDRCNLRCRYCMPPGGVPSIPHQEILRYDEIERLVGIMAGLGVRRVRLTGGEPLVRKGVQGLAAALRKIPGIEWLGITTNGILLEEMAAPLCAAGVDGVNISLDTTDAARYEQLTCRDSYAAARRGLDAALAQPFSAVKVNCVLSPQSRPQDWLGVVALAKALPVDVRLIEWMPLAEGDAAGGAVSAGQALEQIARQYGSPAALGPDAAGGPASYYALPGFRGRLGIIPAISHNFCAGCNRVRLSATGDLKLCLFYDVGTALKPLLRGGAADEEIAGAITAALAKKPARHSGRPLAGTTDDSSRIDRPCGMFRIGG